MPTSQIVLVENPENKLTDLVNSFEQLGYSYKSISEKKQVFKWLHLATPRIIIVDIEWPDINDPESISKFNALREKNRVIAVCSGETPEITKDKWVGSCDGYILKNISLAEVEKYFEKYLVHEKNNVSGEDRICNKKNAKEKLYSLTLMDADDEDFIRSIVELFVKNTPISISEMKSACKKEEWNVVKSLAHKLKPHFIIFGAPHVQESLQRIETLIIDNHIDKDDLFKRLKCIEGFTSLMIKQIKEDMHIN